MILVELQYGEFKILVKEISVFLKDAFVRLSGLLTELLVTQCYKELTGQVIIRVTESIKKIECNLVYTLTLYSDVEAKYAADIVERPNKYQNEADMLFVKGSMWDAINKQDVASGQYDVDDLLSGLGF